MSVTDRREREREHRRQEILDAARQAFLAKGYGATTIDSIAAKVEISPALIYKHFHGKAALFASIVDEGLDRLYEVLCCAVRPEQTGQRALHAIADAYLCFYVEQRDYFNVLNFYDHVQGQTPFPHPIREQIQSKVVACLRVVSDTLEEGQRKGEFRLHDSWQTANVFWGAFNGILLLEAHGKTKLARTDLQPLINRMLDMFLQSVDVQEHV